MQHVWPADQSQIYRKLAALAGEGLAETEVIPQEDKTGRKVYHVTGAGRAELRQWFAAAPPSDKRSAFLVQVFFASALSDQEALAILQRKAAELQDV